MEAEEEVREELEETTIPEFAEEEMPDSEFIEELEETPAPEFTEDEETLPLSVSATRYKPVLTAAI